MDRILAVRRAHYGPNTSLHYDPAPLHIVRGEGCWLFDDSGRAYLDAVNNVTHLGHGNAEVADAVARQLATLNTNSRYLHGALTEYTNELLATLSPPQLEVLYMVNSGSEANDLALRIATAARPEATHVVVLGGAYHGHTSALIDISPYKFWGKGGAGRKPHVHVMPCPDPLRGEHLDGAAAARAAVAQARAAGGRVAAFIAESILSCGGQIILPPGYLRGVYDVMRAEGAVCIADEVQCGFGRVGTAFWGYQTQGVVPDIVTIGKPMGNGYPVAGLVTTRALADAFANGMEYFNTYGGSTAQAVAALTVLRAIRRDNLQAHAQEVGEYLTARLQALQMRFCSRLADVRGMGLMVGVECVRPSAGLAPAPAFAAWVKSACRAHSVLISTDGPFDNVLKLKPPMVFTKEAADIVVDRLTRVLSEELTPEVAAQLDAEEAEVWARVYGPRKALFDANAAELGLPTRASPPAIADAPPTVTFASDVGVAAMRAAAPVQLSTVRRASLSLAAAAAPTPGAAPPRSRL